MDDILSRIFENLADRLSGPMKFRLVLQPLMAIIYAIRDGRRDAREGRPPYFWAFLSSPGHRWELVRDGWKGVGKVFVLAIILDAVYQFIVLRWFYPGEAIITAIILAFVPYLLLRGVINRLTPRK